MRLANAATGDTLDTAIWSTIEQGLAISAGSLATTRPLFRLITSGFSPTTGDLSGYTAGAGTRASHSGLGSFHLSRADDVRLSRMGKTGRYSEHKTSPSASDDISRGGPNKYSISIHAERNATPEPQGHIMVTTDVQSVRHPLQKSESEEWLAYGVAR